MVRQALQTGCLQGARDAVGVGRTTLQLPAPRLVVLDLVFIALLILFTLAALLYEWGCDLLMSTDSTLDRT